MSDKNKDWVVTIQRCEYRSHSFRVTAKDKKEAEEKAYEESCNHNFMDDSVDGASEEVVQVAIVPIGGA